MSRYQRPDARSRHLLVLAGIATLALSLSTPTRGQEDTELDLKPTDFVPEEPVAIRVDDLQPGKAGSDVSVTIANRTGKDVLATVECTLADADREDLGVATGQAVAVAAGGRTTTTVTGAEAAKFAECRVRDAK